MTDKPISVTVVPAQPGFALVDHRRDMNGNVAEYVKFPVVAWIVAVYSTDGPDFEGYRRTVEPVTLGELNYYDCVQYGSYYLSGDVYDNNLQFNKAYSESIEGRKAALKEWREDQADANPIPYPPAAPAKVTP